MVKIWVIIDILLYWFKDLYSSTNISKHTIIYDYKNLDRLEMAKLSYNSHQFHYKELQRVINMNET